MRRPDRFAVCVLVALAGCTSSNPDRHGDEGYSCYPNATCNGALVCLDGVCVGRVPDLALIELGLSDDLAVAPDLSTGPDLEATADLAVGAVDDLGMLADLSETDLHVGNPEDLAEPTADIAEPADLDDHLALRLLPVAVPLKQDGGVDYYEIHVTEAQQQVLPGNKTTIWGFDGSWPGPTVHATLGRPVTLRIFNDLPVTESLSIHNHGHNVASQYDGHPSANTISKGNSYDYKYPNNQGGGTAPNLRGASTYFLRDNVADLTLAHSTKGITAFYIIHPMAGSIEAALNLPSGDYDVPLMIEDRSFNSDNSINLSTNVVTGYKGAVLTVNGTRNPYFEVARRKYRFRVLNGASARRLNLALSAGTIHQIGSDGGLLPSTITPSSILLGPAERADIVVDFSEHSIGDVVTITNSDPFDPAVSEILQFRVVRNETDTSSLPSQLDPAFVRYKETAGTDMVPAESVPPTTRERSMVFGFSSATSLWRINGRTYNPTQYEFGDSADTTENTKLGDTEVWSLINNDIATQVPIPFHQHLVQFQIIDVCATNNPTCGTPPVASQQGWKDTVLVPPQSIVRVKMNFYFNGPESPASVFPGGYVFHGQNLAHKDYAMMLQQLISP